MVLLRKTRLTGREASTAQPFQPGRHNQHNEYFPSEVPLNSMKSAATATTPKIGWMGLVSLDRGARKSQALQPPQQDLPAMFGIIPLRQRRFSHERPTASTRPERKAKQHPYRGTSQKHRSTRHHDVNLNISTRPSLVGRTTSALKPWLRRLDKMCATQLRHHTVDNLPFVAPLRCRFPAFPAMI